MERDVGSGEGGGQLDRRNDGWLARWERPFIEGLAHHVPAGWSADHLTGIGFGGAVLAALSYPLAAYWPGWLWVADLGLVVNWLGDSLDGTVARLRRAERPRYGFFLDQSVDVLAQTLFAAGLALSGFVQPAIAASGLAAFLAMTVLGLLRAETRGVFELALGGFGLTEVRCMFAAFNALLYFLPPRPFGLIGATLRYSDLLGAGWVLINLGFYLWTMTGEVKRLAREEPPPGRGA